MSVGLSDRAFGLASSHIFSVPFAFGFHFFLNHIEELRGSNYPFDLSLSAWIAISFYSVIFPSMFNRARRYLVKFWQALDWLPH